VRQFARLFTMWRHTRLVVMASVIAAIHAAALIPFKAIQLLPGVTDVRPAMALPVVFSVLFGPAAAWGTAMGNTIGDLFGSLGPGTLFGFAGNLLYGYVPHRVWSAWRGGAPSVRSAGDWSCYMFGLVGASACCGLVIGWGVHLFGLFPFGATAGIILVNNLLVGSVLGWPFLLAIYPRVARMNLLYADLAGLPPARPGLRLLPRLASLALTVIALAGIGAGYLAWTSGASDATVTQTVTPFVIAVALIVPFI